MEWPPLQSTGSGVWETKLPLSEDGASRDTLIASWSRMIGVMSILGFGVVV
jgi:hypothetical protein